MIRNTYSNGDYYLIDAGMRNHFGGRYYSVQFKNNTICTFIQTIDEGKKIVDALATSYPNWNDSYNTTGA